MIRSRPDLIQTWTPDPNKDTIFFILLKIIEIRIPDSRSNPHTEYYSLDSTQPDPDPIQISSRSQQTQSISVFNI